MNPTKKRKYNECYLDMGFTDTNDCQPQCVICLKVLPNSSGKYIPENCAVILKKPIRIMKGKRLTIFNESALNYWLFKTK